MVQGNEFLDLEIKKVYTRGGPYEEDVIPADVTVQELVEWYGYRDFNEAFKKFEYRYVHEEVKYFNEGLNEGVLKLFRFRRAGSNDSTIHVAVYDADGNYLGMGSYKNH